MNCIPCLLFSDEVLRGEGQQKNQGNAFVKAFFFQIGRNSLNTFVCMKNRNLTLI